MYTDMAMTIDGQTLGLLPFATAADLDRAFDRAQRVVNSWKEIGGPLAASYSLILKGSEETPDTAVQISRALHDAGLPAGVSNLVFGEPAALPDHSQRVAS
jgi:acyl-CoA reductase-like NAD-dependent aldehyde dehydrogenase